MTDGLAVTDVGSVYVAGWFGDSADLDPTSGVDIVDSLGFIDIALVKLNPDGSYAWGRHWGGDLDGGSYWWEKGMGVALDQAGDVYVTGIFRGTCDFDPGLGEAIFTSNGYTAGGFDVFLTKFDPDGNHVWATAWGSIDDTGSSSNDRGDVSFGVATDSISGVYVSCGFVGTVDFDPGTGVVERTAINDDGDLCLVKYDNDGTCLWARSWAAYGWVDTLNSNQWWGGSYVTVNNNNDVYLTGYFDGLVDFDPGLGETEVDGRGPFFSKFDSTGNFISVSPFLATGVGGGEFAIGIYTDSENNVLVSGIIGATLDFDPGPGVENRTAVASQDGYICKIASDGTFLWVNLLSPSPYNNYCQGWGITTDSQDNVYACGLFDGIIDFDPGPGVVEHDVFQTSGYLVKYLPDGTW
jgi:hypothetical protein